MAPAQAVHQPPDMIAVVAYSELARDQFRDARRGPQVGGVAMGQRPLQE